MTLGVGRKSTPARGEVLALADEGGGVDRVLETKLHVPVARPEWVARPGLIHRLDHAAAKLVLVAAPTGYGKTTLLALWRTASAAHRSFAWITLGQEDNDPVVLWRLVVHALQRACPTLDGGNLLGLVQGQFPDVTGIFLPRLVHELAAVPGRVTVVLDDYQLIQEPACHEQLGFLLSHLPPQAQIAISSRADPPLPLAGLRAGGDLAEFRMPELRLTADEANAVIRAVSGAELGEDDLHELVRRTEGWPAAVYLEALSLRGGADPSRFVHQLTDSDGYITEFLAEQVISQQPDHVRQFLLHTAVLGRLTASLCDAVNKTANAGEILGMLERENLFLVPLDDRREWFRYHHLFAQALRSQLLRTEPGLIPLLHQRASAWHRQRGSVIGAIHHALAAADYGAAVTLIAEHWWAFVNAGQMLTVREWLRALGEGQISAHPLAAHCAAWIAALGGESGSIRRWLPVIEAGRHRGPLPDGMQSLQFSATLLKATFGFWGYRQMRDAAARAVDLEDDMTSPWYAAARTASAATLYFAGEYRAASRRLHEALLSEPPSTVVRLLASSLSCLAALELGRLGQAQALAQAARDLEADPVHGLAAAPQGSFAHLASGAVHAAEGRLHEARSALEHALQSRREWPGINPWITIESQLRLIPVLQDQGDAADATALLAKAKGMLASIPDVPQAQLDRLQRLERRLQGGERAGPAGEPLTDREQAVLRLLPGALSLREIARELNVSANTIKSHTRAIYRKLGVSGRTEAVGRVRELYDLLSRRTRIAGNVPVHSR